MVHRAELSSLLSVLVGAALVSCSHGKDVDIMASFPVAGKVECVLMAENVLDGMPYGFVVADSSVLAFSSSMGAAQLFSYDLKDGARHYSLKFGRGPGESLHANSIQLVGDSVYVAVDPGMIYSYDRAELINRSNVIPRSSRRGNGQIAADGSVISFSRNIDDASNSMMYCTETKTDTSWFGFFPEDEISYPAGDESKQTAWQGKMVLSPDGSHGMFLFYYALGFDIIGIPSKTVSHHIWLTPQVSVNHVDVLGVNVVKPEKNYVRRFIDAAAAYEGFYVLCTPDGARKYVLYYDWEGIPVKAYEVEEDSKLIYVEPDGGAVYLLSANENGACDLLSFRP
mgnify:CR=1 FL=1